MDDARYSEGAYSTIFLTKSSNDTSVIRCTVLDYDITLLPAGDDTEIGEKGITLRFVYA